jgi:AhpD family alkylhydroperoxidase
MIDWPEIALRCDDCIAFHVKAALQQGASRTEVTEALGMAIYREPVRR